MTMDRNANLFRRVRLLMRIGNWLNLKHDIQSRQRKNVRHQEETPAGSGFDFDFIAGEFVWSERAMSERTLSQREYDRYGVPVLNYSD